ncbi:hypothetical protein EJB05_27576 [Eragrostis curvula]|uniref:Uncharacterized protein n=1 Tax=Eragrostis curvula TaxID=38414 RepID=A0A5J9UNF4_9POAL|nr:hypothetical protein EJB05_27576 [Eragrostis curvula]
MEMHTMHGDIVISPRPTLSSRLHLISISISPSQQLAEMEATMGQKRVPAQAAIQLLCCVLLATSLPVTMGQKSVEECRDFCKSHCSGNPFFCSINCYTSCMDMVSLHAVKPNQTNAAGAPHNSTAAEATQLPGGVSVPKGTKPADGGAPKN